MRSLYTCLVIALLFAARAEAQIPQMMSYQGILSDAAGLVDRNVSLTFKIYESEDDSAPIWEETHSEVTVEGGAFAVTLGSQTPIDAPFDTAYWLGISVDDGVEQSPRTRLLPAPYAFVARHVELAPSLDQAYREETRSRRTAGP